MWNVVLLGVVQGLTEFLPISSSGHLVLMRHFMDLPGDQLFLDLALHIGTLLPVFVVYWEDLLRMIKAPFVESGPLSQRPGTRLMGLILLGTIPTGLMGVLFEDLFEAMFSDMPSLVVSFAITALLLTATKWAKQGDTTEMEMTAWQAVLIGIAQGISIVPAISRSGATIAAALFLGMRREYAARYSFLMSIPAILGAFLLKLRDVTAEEVDIPATLVGALTALVVGYLALKVLVRIVKAGDFSRFAWYAWVMAAVSLIITLTGK